MSIIHRYVTQSVLKQLAVILAAVTGIYLTIDFFEKIDDFLDAKLLLSRVATYFALRIPFVVAQVTPVAILLSVLVSLGLMVKHNEVTALQSAGAHPGYLLQPILSIGAAAAVGLFFFSEAVVPFATLRADTIWRQEVRKEDAVTARENDIWIRGKGFIGRIEYYPAQGKTVHGVSLNFFDEGFRLVRSLDAAQAVYETKVWRLQEVIDQRLLGDDYVVSHVPELRVSLDLAPEDLQGVVKPSQDMGYKELAAYAKRVEEEGYDATVYRVDLAAKVAFPLVCLVMAVVGAAIALRRKGKDALTLGVVMGIATAFAYWIVHSLCVSLGHAGLYPAVPAAWTANLVFGAFGMVLLLGAL